MCTFFFSMLQNPDVQRKAQAELDRVVPPGELPRFEDEESLPYITAITKEVFRCGNVAPLGNGSSLR
jgi:cytochrome P450